MIKISITFLFAALFSLSVNAVAGKQSIYQMHDANKMIVPIGGNTWTINGAKVSNNGLSDWTSSITSVQTYIYLSQSGTLHLSLNMNPEGRIS